MACGRRDGIQTLKPTIRYKSDGTIEKGESAKALAYNHITHLMGNLRHADLKWQERWPIELADDRRDPIHKSNFYAGCDEWLDYNSKHINCVTEKMIGQDNYVMVAFEAEAMQRQFLLYTKPYGVSFMAIQR